MTPAPARHISVTNIEGGMYAGGRKLNTHHQIEQHSSHKFVRCPAKEIEIDDMANVIRPGQFAKVRAEVTTPAGQLTYGSMLSFASRSLLKNTSYHVFILIAQTEHAFHVHDGLAWR